MRSGARARGWLVGVVVLAGVLGLASGAGAANIWYVDGNAADQFSALQGFTCCPVHPAYFNIQPAIDAASPGDTILVKGSWIYTDVVLIETDNLTIVGEGDAQIAPLCNGGDPIVTINASGVRFQGFHIRDIDDCWDDGIRVNGSDNAIVANWIENAGEDGIDLNGDSKRNTILGNWITGSEDNGIETSAGNGWGHLIQYNVVSNSEFDDGIQVEVRNVTVDFNVVVDNGDDGIDIDDSDADNFKVTNNIVLDNNQDNDDNADLDRDTGATGTFGKNVIGTCQLDDSATLSPCPAF